MVTKPARPSVKTAIQYNPRSRGLRLALAYTRIARNADEGVYDIYGFLAGYEGGGCYADEFFHVEESGGVFTTYSSSDGFLWAVDRIGLSGLDGKRLERPIEALLESIQDFVFRRWLKWTVEGLPDLQDAAKRRLNCWRRRAFWLSPGFDDDLLRFMSQRWPLSVDFSERAKEFRRHHESHLAQFRAKQRGIENVVSQYPEIVEGGLTLIGRDSIGKRVVLLFADRMHKRVVVEPKWGEPTLTEVKNLASYKGTRPTGTKAGTRLIVVGTRATPEIRRSLDEHGVRWLRVHHEKLMSFLRKRGDDNLAAVFDHRNFEW